MDSQNIANEFCIHSADLLDQSMIKILHCLDQLSEDQIWWRPQATMNSVGNLCVHLAGNLRQWGVVPFGDSIDQRDREQEFSVDLRETTDELKHSLEAVVSEAKMIWRSLDTETLLKPTNIQGFDVTFLHAVSHTSSHFVGHAHQIISLTRLQLANEYRFQWSPESDRGQLPI